MSLRHNQTRTSVDPRLSNVNAFSLSQDPSSFLGDVTQPYPTREQHEIVERNYSEALSAWKQHEGGSQLDDNHKPDGSSHHHHPRPPPPVRQPPTMLAALQRPDLTSEGRLQVLQKLAPAIGTLEKKYKIIFNSDARRDPLDTQPSDFTMDVTPDLLPTRVNGFEMIGYSFPQSEWAIEPYENALPMRYGWSAYPGCRGFGLHLKTYLNERRPLPGSTSAVVPSWTIASDPSTSPFPFEYDGPSIAIYAEQPLVRNPIVRIQVLEADVSSGLPKRIVLTFDRRVGTSLSALMREDRNRNLGGGQPLLVLDNVGFQSSVGTYPGRYALRPDSLLESPYPLEYMDLPIQTFPSVLPEEPILNSNSSSTSTSASTSASPLHTLTIIDPLFTAYFVDGSEIAVESGLGMLYCRPPASAKELARRLSVQFTDLIRRRKAYEESIWSGGGGGGGGGSVGPVATCPLSRCLFSFQAQNRQVANTVKGIRFCMEVEWSFEGELVQQAIRFAQRWNMDDGTLQQLLNPMIASCADGFGTRMGLPVEISQTVFTDTPFHATVCSGLPPRVEAVETVDLTPLPEGAAVESYFAALNTTAASMQFEASDPAPPVDPDEFLIPILLDSTTTPIFINVRAGEYRPWSFAAAITVAARSIPALRGLHLSVTPVAIDSNSYAGFRFASMAPTPQTFTLPFSLASDTTMGPNFLPPRILGFRNITYTGLSVYDPRLLSLNDDPYTGFASPVTFPCAELGLGIPSPLPTVPTFLEAFGRKRIQVMNQNPPPSAIRLNSGDNIASGCIIPGLTEISLTLNRATLFHHMQPLRVDVSIEADKLLLAALEGQEEAAGQGTSTSIIFGGEPVDDNPLAPSTTFPAGNGTSAGRDDAALTFSSILATILTFHDPLTEKDVLRSAMIRLLGKVSKRDGGYGGFQVGGPSVMDQDGPYRQLLENAFLPAQRAALSIPSPVQIDGLLTDLASNIKMRSAFLALVNALLRIINSPVLGGNPLSTSLAANGNVTGSPLSSVITAYRNATRDSRDTDFTKDYLTDLVNVALWKSSIDDIVVPFPPASPLPGGFLSPLLPDQTYYVDVDPSDPLDPLDPISPSLLWVQPSVGSALDPTKISVVPLSPTRYAFCLHPGICQGTTGPFTVDIMQSASGSSRIGVPVQAYIVTNPGSTTPPIFSGRTFALNYDPSALTFASADEVDQVANVRINSVQGIILLTARHNVVSGTATINFTAPGPTSVVMTVPLVDSTTTTLAKMLLVANNYTASFPASARVMQKGSVRYPFDAAAALRDLGRGISSVSEDGLLLDALLDADDPGVDDFRTSRFVPTLAPWNSISPDLQASVPNRANELDPRILGHELMSIMSLTPRMGTGTEGYGISRLNEHPFSMDFVTLASRKVRPERFGFQEDEYPSYVYPSSVFSSDQALNQQQQQLRTAHTATHACFSTTFPCVPLRSIGSCIDIERGGSPYLMLSIEINGQPSSFATPWQQLRLIGNDLGEGVSDLARVGDVISIGTSHFPQKDRQIIKATAYVEVGTDGSNGIRLLDRQDDRAPTFFPTSTYVHSVRFVLLRPDGTLYNFHGRRTMVALRFISHPDNPNFISAASTNHNHKTS